MLHLLVALRPEASPFLDAWSLRRDPSVRGFDLYEGRMGDGPDAISVRLVRTGIGKAQMAAGVGWLAGRRDAAPAIWINAGIAGHSRLAPGEVRMAHRVVDVSSGRAGYPPLVVEPPCPTGELRTVDVPETAFGDEGAAYDMEGSAYDMEGSAFVTAARRFATAELVHCLKVVSDGPDAPVDALHRERIGELARALVPAVEELVRRLRPVLREVRAAEDDPPDQAKLLETLHFTVSDQVQLRKELRRRSVLAPDEPLPDGVWTARRGKDANRLLRAWLDEKAPS